jgi:oxygen-independent coproporphyrinogen-3 oxidase
LEINFKTNCLEFFADLADTICLFFPDFANAADAPFVILHGAGGKYKLKNTVTIKYEGRIKSYKYTDKIEADFKDALLYKRLLKRYIKLSLYKSLSDFFSRKMPWGSLTGIRPVSLAYALLAENDKTDLAAADDGGGANLAAASDSGRADLAATTIGTRQALSEISEVDKTRLKQIFSGVLLVSPQKTELMTAVLDSQAGKILRRSDMIDLYVGIPFCTSRCSYCSFSSGLISKYGNYIESYVLTLLGEIEHSKRLIDKRGYKLRSIYIGGGTPTSLSPAALDRILAALPKGAQELTVEAGRPDTATAEGMDVFAKNSVSRICINPQTFNDETLKKIGRSHTSEDIYKKFALAKSYGFLINCDLIAALPNETFFDFSDSLDKCIGLAPDNITVHTLALKRGSTLTEQNERHTEENIVKQMVEYSYDTLKKSAYFPYYLYRQKYMAGNLENVGYSLRGRECLYNIDIMEETLSIIACGAGAISKRIFYGEGKNGGADGKGEGGKNDTDGGKSGKSGAGAGKDSAHAKGSSSDECAHGTYGAGKSARIERAANVKDILTYLSRAEDMKERKDKLFGG